MCHSILCWEHSTYTISLNRTHSCYVTLCPYRHLQVQLTTNHSADLILSMTTGCQGEFPQQLPPDTEKPTELLSDGRTGFHIHQGLSDTTHVEKRVYEHKGRKHTCNAVHIYHKTYRTDRSKDCRTWAS